MIKREFKALMVDDFRDKWLNATAEDENCSRASAEGAYAGRGLDALDNRISGQVVTIMENEYPDGNNDFFEKEDNNFLMHPCLFSELTA